MQFTQLGSPKDGVVDASVRELNYQCEIMDRMGIGADGVMVFVILSFMAVLLAHQPAASIWAVSTATNRVH